VVVVILSEAFLETSTSRLKFSVNSDSVNLSKIVELLCGENGKKLAGRPKIFFLLAKRVELETDMDSSNETVLIFK
jgi:hypothetical protein